MTVEDWLGKDNQLGIDIWHKKYQFNGETFDEWLDRVSANDLDVRQLIVDKKFLLGGRILANRGLPNKGVKSTYSNCYVLSVDDSIESIYQCCSDIARTYSYGGGVGIDISNLRPKGAPVNNSAKYTTGACSFMPTFDLVTSTIGQSGRRGALMISLDINHPDVEEFIDIKANTDKITNANISVRVNDNFMQAVENDDDYILHWPCNSNAHFPTNIPYDELIKGPNWYCRKVKARRLFEKLVANNWDYGEPGILFWDRISGYHMMSNDPSFSYSGVNPCAEEPLPNGGACLLGSMNLAVYDFSETKGWIEFSRDVQIATRGLNKVLDEGLSLHPLKIQRDTCATYNQIGLGLMGLADALINQGIIYGSEEAQYFAKSVTQSMLINSYIASCDLNSCNLQMYPHIKESRFYRDNIAPHLTDEYLSRCPKNSQLLTIAPTGTLSTMLGVSGGAEPIFAMEYERTTKSLHGKDVTYKVRHTLAQKWLDSHPDSNNDIKYLPEYFVAASDITVEDRVSMQSALQTNIDASISSTVNLPKEATIEDVRNIYMNAWKKQLKGITIFRDGCKRASILTTQKQSTPTIGFESHSAPKRPKVLDADFYQVKAQGEIFLVFVGLLNDKPYEVFALPTIFENEKKPNCRGTITKIGKRHYRFECENFTIENIALDDNDKDYRQITLLTSGLLRHGMPIQSIMKLEDKCNDVITSFNKAIWKVLSKYAPNDSTESCPECGSKVVREGGCKHCSSCGWSACMTIISKKNED